MSDINSREFEPRSAIYTPAEVAAYGLAAVKTSKLSADSGIGIGIDIAELRDYFPPVMAGEICFIIAQTSNFKTGFMDFIEYSHAKRLSDMGITDEIIIHVSVEDLIEEQAYLQLARISGEDAGNLGRGVVQDWSKLEQASIRVGTTPIFRIGASLARAEEMPNLYLSNMVRAIKEIADGKFLDFKPKIAGLFFDYLQAFPIDPEIKQTSRDAQRRLQVRSDVYRLYQAAAYFKCPVFCNVQAKQHLDGANPPVMMPGVYDGEESSSIGQRASRVIGLWMPKTTHPTGTTFTIGNNTFTAHENSLWIKVLKQRGRLPAGKTWPCLIDYKTNMIAPEYGAKR